MRLLHWNLGVVVAFSRSTVSSLRLVMIIVAGYLPIRFQLSSVRSPRPACVECVLHFPHTYWLNVELMTRNWHPWNSAPPTPHTLTDFALSWHFYCKSSFNNLTQQTKEVFQFLQSEMYLPATLEPCQLTLRSWASTCTSQEETVRREICILVETPHFDESPRAVRRL